MPTSTITQTLPVITQSATAYQNMLVGVAVASSTLFVLHEETLISTASGASSFSTSVVETLVSTANADSVLTFDVVIPVHETAVASERFTSSETTLLISSAKGSDEIAQFISLTLTETANASSSFEILRSYTLEETATATEVIIPGVIYNQIVAETAVANSTIYTGLQELLESTGTATSSQTIWTTALENISSTANGTDALTPWATVHELLKDTANGSESFSFEGSVYNNTLISTASAKEVLWAKDFSAVAWVLNTQSGGLTNYDNFGFDSIAFHAGKLYATSPEGLFELGADDDDGRNIAAVSKGGFLDFGTDGKKRISDIYIGYTGGDLEFEVETLEGAYTYELDYRDADIPHNNRLKVGRGLSSRFWRFTQRNIGGADFQIYDIAVNLATSKRRL